MSVVPKKHSTERGIIYHLSYPEGDSLNDYIPKDPYSLQYVRVDDAIRIIRSLGPGSFMAKTDLKSAFRLIPVHPSNWHLLAFTGRVNTMWTYIFPLGFAVPRTFSINCLMPWNGS